MPVKMKKKKGFADEMLELLDARAPKEVDAEDEGEAVEGTAWEDELLSSVGMEKGGGMRLRGDLGGAFTEGTYKGKVVNAENAFGNREDENPEEEEEEGDSEEQDEKDPGYGTDYSSDDFAAYDKLIGNENINEAAISAKMDNIFGDLDDESGQEEEGETYEDFLASNKTDTGKKTPKRINLKRNRDDFEEGSDMESDEEADNARQLAELKAATEKSSKNIMSVIETDSKKSIDTKNQYKIWSKLVACRIHLQQPLSFAARLPQHYASEYRNSAEIASAISSVKQGLGEVMDELHSLRIEMLNQNKAVKAQSYSPAPKHGAARGVDLEKYWRLCVASNSMVNIDEVLDQWHARAQLTGAQSGGESSLTSGSSAAKQVQDMLKRDSERLKRKSQKNRTGQLPYGHPSTEEIKKNPKLMQSMEYVHDEHIYDDSDFYSWLLTDYMHNCSDAKIADAGDLAEAQRRAKDPSRLLVDKRRSKARKLNFEPHQKLVGYAAPDPQDVPPMVDALIKNLFSSA
eukprot:TRINITY_DN2929_c0_g1_i1.p1 TRINITY_DN2929_c0_g1~~TRINITY_DN2929_c0_g1_i1.p1  ORF type:complete len:516 (+),score=160.18 TRINITY_DN2929_c0_g1_i1:41-1588(+)